MHIFTGPLKPTAFQNLKDTITVAPILALPNFTNPFIVETDASGTGMGAVLMQERHPIAFFSKQFCPKLLKSSTYVRKLAPIITAVKKWRQYLLGHHFVILVDHRSLRELMNQAVQTLEQHRYLARLLGFDYTIQYRSGKTNVVADALSRVQDDQTTFLYLLLMPQFIFLEDLCKELASLLAFIELRKQIQAKLPTAQAAHMATIELFFHQTITSRISSITYRRAYGVAENLTTFAGQLQVEFDKRICMCFHHKLFNLPTH